MTCPLDKYLLAVAKRKAIDTKTNSTNYAIVKQLEDDDLPRLIEIIVEFKRANEQVMRLGETTSEEEEPTAVEMMAISTRAHIRAESLADGGSHARWGGIPDGN